MCFVRPGSAPWEHGVPRAVRCVGRTTSAGCQIATMSRFYNACKVTIMRLSKVTIVRLCNVTIVRLCNVMIAVVLPARPSSSSSSTSSSPRSWRSAPAAAALPHRAAAIVACGPPPPRPAWCLEFAALGGDTAAVRGCAACAVLSRWRTASASSRAGPPDSACVSQAQSCTCHRLSGGGYASGSPAICETR